MKNYTLQNYTTQPSRDWARWCQKKDNSIVNYDEYLVLRDIIIHDSYIANLFFIKKMRPLAQELQMMVHNHFHIYISENDIAAMVLYIFYQFGSWTRLKSYDAKCSIFSWVAKIAKQRIYQEVIVNGYVRPTALSAMTTSLTIKSMRYADERMAVVSLVEDKPCRMLLSLLYVQKLDKEMCMQTMQLTDEQFKALLRKATKLLKTKLIEKDTMLWRREVTDENGNIVSQVVNLVSLALKDRTGQVATFSNDNDGTFKHDKADDNLSVYDLLDGMLPGQTSDMPLEQQWNHFLEHAAYSTPMGALQLNVWMRVYLRHQPYAEIARRLGISVANTYNHFKNANQKIERHIACWYRHAL